MAFSTLAVFALVTTAIDPARAVPPKDPEGGTAALSAALAQASQGWTGAKAKLTASRNRQSSIQVQIKASEQNIAQLSETADELGVIAYRNEIPAGLAVFLKSDSAESVLRKASLLKALSHRNNRALDALTKARKELQEQKRELDAEITVEAAAEASMAKRKSDAERALAAAGGGRAGTEVGGTGGRSARAAPREQDGTFQSQGCRTADPTSRGCLTPRTLHALQQARAAGFTRYTACFRSASFGEHGKGRACDFAASPKGFGGAATGGDKDYGNRLANWFIANADRLGVLYVIWYRQIWMPSSGWRSYSGRGSPSAAHTNHVHLSVL